MLHSSISVPPSAPNIKCQSGPTRNNDHLVSDYSFLREAQYHKIEEIGGGPKCRLTRGRMRRSRRRANKNEFRDRKNKAANKTVRQSANKKAKFKSNLEKSKSGNTRNSRETSHKQRTDKE